MPRRDLIFRVFVSSTFSDLVQERNSLQEQVFPELREYCRQHGARFQAIDLRWGVSQEAALDQQTMSICTEELLRCQKLSPKPNFVVLLGNRYGWRPLPSQIDATEFEAILVKLSDEEQQKLQAWYRRDDNAVPPQYVLLARTVECPEDATQEQLKAARQQEATEWWRIETELREILLRGMKEVIDPDNPERRKYVDSATHQEIRYGALEAANPEEHVFCYLREIDGLPADETAATYRDLKHGTPDAEAEGRLNALKKELTDLLPDENIHQYRAAWEGGHPAYDLDQLCEDVKRDLMGIIEQELKDFRQSPELKRQRLAHREFAEDRSRSFVGRTDLLKLISDYVMSSEGDQPLIIYGRSGSGKTALMAKSALDLIQSQLANQESAIIFRFIGATPGSSDLRSLLTDLCRELGVQSTPQDMKELVRTFRNCLSPRDQRDLEDSDDDSEKARPVENTILFLDALDQLNPTDNARMLYWLPRRLAPEVKLVMSVLETKQDEEQAGKADEPFDLAQHMWPDAMVELGALGEKEGEALLEAWLAEAGRDLQGAQKQDVLGKFKACGNPLYLKLAFEETRHWKSWEGLPCGSDKVPGLSNDVPGILEDLFRRLELPEHHGPVLVECALRGIAAAKNGLTEDELIDILSTEEEAMQDFFRRSPESPAADRLPVVIWSRLFADLEPYMTRRRADGTIVMDFYHRQVRDAVVRRYLPDDARRRAHLHLAGYFDGLDYWAESPQQREGGMRLPATPRPSNIRKVAELPFHRIEAAKLGGRDDPNSPLWHAVVDLLSDWQFLEAKCMAQLYDDLLADVRRARSALARLSSPSVAAQVARLSVLLETIELSRSTLVPYPELTFTQLLPFLYHNPATQGVATRWSQQREGPFATFLFRSQGADEQWRGICTQIIRLESRPKGPLFVDRQGDRAVLLLQSQLSPDDPDDFLGLRHVVLGQIERWSPTHFEVTTSRLSLGAESEVELLQQGDGLRSRRELDLLASRFPDASDGAGLEELELSVQPSFESNLAELPPVGFLDPDKLQTTGVLTVTEATGVSRRFECFSDNITAIAAVGSRLLVCGSAQGELCVVDLLKGPKTPRRVAELGISKICSIPGQRACVFSTICGVLGYLHPNGQVSGIRTPHEHGIANCAVMGDQAITIGADSSAMIWSLARLAKHGVQLSSQGTVINTRLATSRRHCCLRLKRRSVPQRQVEIVNEPHLSVLRPFTSQRVELLSGLTTRIPMHRRTGQWYQQQHMTRVIDLETGGEVPLAYDESQIVDVDVTSKVTEGTRERATLVFHQQDRPTVRVPVLSSQLADACFSSDGRFVALFFSHARGFVVADLHKGRSLQLPLGYELRDSNLETPVGKRFLDYRPAGLEIGRIRELVVFAGNKSEALFYSSGHGVCRLDLEDFSWEAVFQPQDDCGSVQCYAYTPDSALLVGTHQGMFEVRRRKAAQLVEGNFIQCGALRQRNLHWAVTEDGRMCFFDQGGKIDYLPQRLATLPQFSPSERYVLLVSWRKLVEIYDLRENRILFRYGYEGVPPEQFATRRGFVLASIGGDLAHLKLQRLEPW